MGAKPPAAHRLLTPAWLLKPMSEPKSTISRPATRKRMIVVTLIAAAPNSIQPNTRALARLVPTMTVRASSETSQCGCWGNQRLQYTAIAVTSAVAARLTMLT